MSDGFETFFATAGEQEVPAFRGQERQWPPQPPKKHQKSTPKVGS